MTEMTKTQPASAATARLLGAFLKFAHDIMRKDKGLTKLMGEK
jgi:hypothetical protein